MIKRIGFGLALWAILYGLSIPLLPISRSEPLVFKALIVSLAMVVSSIILVVYFKDIKKDFFVESVKLAVTWVVVNWIMDVVALLPFTHQTLPQYFAEIGIEYLAASAPIIALGYILKIKTEK